MNETHIDTDKTLRAIGKDASQKFMLQIGAMDGVSFDEIRGYTDLFKWSGLYVEPNPEMYQRMVESYRNHDNVKFEMSAISDYNGEITMLRIPPEVVDSGKVHPCFNGMTSVWPPRNGLGSEGDKPTVDKYGEKISVPCITLKNLLEKHNVNQIDILAIDAEGHDWTIFSQFDFNLYRPSYIKIEYINLSKNEQEELKKKLIDADYVYHIHGQDINAVPKEIHQPTEKVEVKPISKDMHETTIVTGIFDLCRENAGDGFKRSFDHYIKNFKKLLKTNCPMVIFIEDKYEHLVWESRDRSNTFLIKRECDSFKDPTFPFFQQVSDIRSNEDWLSQAGWLRNSTQATLELYNPMVMSKMFMLNDASIFNPFNTDFFVWIDGGITNTVHEGYFTHDKVIEKISNAIDKFLFISYPYKDGGEIHGFKRSEMARYCSTDPQYVCRGGVFGGHKDHINKANSLYYSILQQTLSEGLMGTEESIFTIMSYLQPEFYHRFELKDEDAGLVAPFFEHLKNSNKEKPLVTKKSSSKCALYILTFNSPQQIQKLIDSFYQVPNFLDAFEEKYILDNSTDRNVFGDNLDIATKNGFSIIKKDNIGICGGRQFIAEHFDKTDCDAMAFFEDDMFLNPPSENGFCKNGFRKYIPNLIQKSIKILHRANFDFIKLSFSEFFGDNRTQWSWYNVPQDVREKWWPDYNKLPKHGLDPNAPLTNFHQMGLEDDLTYLTGDIYYANWPQLVSKEGNKKMFLETTWTRPYEQTWMSHMFQLSKAGKLNSGILLCSPITHDRFIHYNQEERVES